MEIRSILVNVGLSDSHAAVTYAARLAETYGAELTGLAAAQPNLVYAGAGGAQLAVDYYAAERRSIEERLERAEARFRGLVPAAVPVRWRSYVAGTTDMLIDQARRADLVVVATDDVVEPLEMLDPGHLVLAGGRPVIVVGGGAREFGLARAVVAWKDTREARRALADALPLLQRATQVSVVTRSEGDTASETESLSDVIAWLGQHGIHAASTLVRQQAEFTEALGLATPGAAPDLIVAGGYGHSRFREWLFGGVTRDLLGAAGVNRLLAN
jgi:nucleotide-binding universal stress UspA family protein